MSLYSLHQKRTLSQDGLTRSSSRRTTNSKWNCPAQDETPTAVGILPRPKTTMVDGCWSSAKFLPKMPVKGLFSESSRHIFSDTHTQTIWFPWHIRISYMYIIYNRYMIYIYMHLFMYTTHLIPSLIKKKQCVWSSCAKGHHARKHESRLYPASQSKDFFGWEITD